MKKPIMLTVIGIAIWGFSLLSCDDTDESKNNLPVWYKDSDGDGKGNHDAYVYSSVQPVGYVSNADDNDDNLPCEEGLPFYKDKDGDGKGDPNDMIYACTQPAGYVDNGDDDKDFPPGGIISIVSLPATNTDAAIGIDSKKTYTHAFDFGDGTIAVINGLQFEKAFTGTLDSAFSDTSSFGYRYIISDTRTVSPSIISNAGADFDQADGSSADLLKDMIFHSGSVAGEGIQVKFMDLTPKKDYSVRFYYRAWAADSKRPILFSGDGGEDGNFENWTMEVDIDKTGGAYYLDYSFTTDDTDCTIKLITQVNNQGVHFYGLTCEEAE